MISPWYRWYTTNCCFCCHVRTGAIILGICLYATCCLDYTIFLTSNTPVPISVVVYPNTIQDYFQQLPGTFPYKEDLMATNTMYLVFAVLLFISYILAFKVLLPPSEDAVANTPKEPPPEYISA